MSISVSLKPYFRFVRTILSLTSLLLVITFHEAQAKNTQKSIESHAQGVVQCSEIAKELKSLKKAQQAIELSLVSNHDLMADSMESYSEALKSSAGKASKTVEESMSKAATSLRARGQKAREMTDKLALLTERLIQSAEACF